MYSLLRPNLLFAVAKVCSPCAAPGSSTAGLGEYLYSRSHPCQRRTRLTASTTCRRLPSPVELRIRRTHISQNISTYMC